MIHLLKAAKAWTLNFSLVWASVAVGYVMVEAVFFVRAGYFESPAGSESLYRHEDLYVSSKPLAVFDSISGYKRFIRPVRIARIVKDEFVFDQTFTPNNAGYISSRDYTHKKTAPDIKRIIVFGDSFTAAEFNPVPWPDRVQEMLENHSGPAKDIELYSFAVNGAGLFNWHSIFFNDVIPNYEFDAVLVASFGDDLARPFSILHYDGPTAYIGRFPTRPKSDADFFENYFSRMDRHRVEVASDAEIDQMLADLNKSWQWPGIKVRVIPYLKSQWRRRQALQDALDYLASAGSLSDGEELYPVDEIERTYGVQQINLLREMIDYCHEKDIPVILASVPTRTGARNVALEGGVQKTIHEQEIESLAHHLGTMHFDGYAPFAVVEPEDIDQLYWLKNDGHWNQAGSDLFALGIEKFLADHASQLPSRSVH